MRIHVGTSGWCYPHWQGPFYPADLPEPEWLPFYARHLPSVEVNSSFYRLPTAENFAAWRDQTPANFLFAVKASRYITHMKKLKDPAQGLAPLLAAMQGLGDKMGPLLLQLPPRWHVNAERLRAFLQAMPKGVQTAFELRDPTWHSQEILDLLAAFNAAFCVYEIGGFASPRRVTADFVYLRLHGPDAPYCGRYGTAALRDWAAWIRRQKVAAAYIYFDNDQAGYAVQDALALQGMLT